MKLRVILLVLLACLGAPTIFAQSSPSPALLALAKREKTLAIVDPATLKVVAKIPAGNDPHEAIASADGKSAYISNYGGGAYNTLSVADLVAQKALPPVDLGALRGPHGLAFAGGKVYFTAEVNKVFGRYDPATRQIDWVLGTGQNRTHMIVVAPDLNHIYTSNVNSGTISIIEKTNGPAGGFPGPPPPGGPGAPGVPNGPGQTGNPPPGPGGLGPGGPPRPDWNETVLETGRGTEGFDVSPDGKELWSAAAQGGTISIIDLAAKRMVQTLQANVGGANRVKFTPDGKFVFVSILFGGGREPGGLRRRHAQRDQTDEPGTRRRRHPDAAGRFARLRRVQPGQLRGGDRSEDAAKDRPHRRRPRTGRSCLGWELTIAD